MSRTALVWLFYTCSTVFAGQSMFKVDEVPQAYLSQVADLVRAGDWDSAHKLAYQLTSSEASLKRSTTWINLQNKLQTAAGSRDDEPVQKQRRAEVSAALELYDLAMKYCEEWVKLLDPQSQDALMARMEVAQIAREAGFDAARRKDYLAARQYFDEVERHGVTWVKELGANRSQMLANFLAGQMDVEARIQFAKGFWIGKSAGEGRYYSDAIAFLQETLESQLSISADQRKSIYSTIRDYSWNDPAQAKVWEERLLGEFPEDINMTARFRVENAQKFYEAKDLQKALGEYRSISEALSNSDSYGIAQFNVGLILKDMGEYEDAIIEFKKLLASQVNDRDPTRNIMSEFRNYRPRAQWEIGNCLRALGRYREALDAYVVAEKKYPFRSTCGNAHAEFAYRYALFQALCYENLGEYLEAARLYWGQVASGGLYNNPTIHLRLLDLYESTGQKAILLELLDSIDGYLRERVANELKPAPDKETLERIKPSATIREAMRIRDMGARHQWSTLIELCRSKGTTAGPEEDYVRTGNWQGTEAVMLMAKNPMETVSFLIETGRKMANQGDYQHDGPDLRWIYFALGECGTDAALDFLEERAHIEVSWSLNSIIFAFSRGGQKGLDRIEKLSTNESTYIQGSIRAWRQGYFGKRPEFEYPPLPKTAELPKSLSQITLIRK